MTSVQQKKPRQGEEVEVVSDYCSLNKKNEEMETSLSIHLDIEITNNHSLLFTEYSMESTPNNHHL